MSAAEDLRDLYRELIHLRAAEPALRSGNFAALDTGSGELRQVGERFNAMVRTLDAQSRRLVDLETMAGWREMARALAHEPAVLLADEPTGNLDEETGSLIIALLTDLARQQGTTLLLVTHSMQVAGAADRVLRLGHGRVTDVSTP